MSMKSCQFLYSKSLNNVNTVSWAYIMLYWLSQAIHQHLNFRYQVSQIVCPIFRYSLFTRLGTVVMYLKMEHSMWDTQCVTSLKQE